MKKVYLLVAFILCMLLTSVTVFAAPAEDNLIKMGMRGDNVKMLQKLLSEKGFYAGEIDGVFGKVTLRATKDFQSSNGLTVDGVADKETLLYLERASSEFNASRASRSMTMNASAYSAYDPGNGHYTCRGSLLRKGLVAVDPTVIPLGTRLFIPGYGYAVADDIGGAIKGNRIDIAFESRSEALQFGRQKITVYILD